MELAAVLVIPALAAGLVLLPALARAAAPITLVASGLSSRSRSGSPGRPCSPAR